jgi:putative hydrolase of the HAD superfamily
MKPDLKIYELVCSSMNVLPQEVIFIDDLKENIQGAVDAGMNGIIFRNVLQLQTDIADIMGKKST